MVGKAHFHRARLVVSPLTAAAVFILPLMQSINPSRHRLLVAIDRYCWMHVLGVLEQYRVSLASAKFSQIQSQREFKTGLRPDRILFFHV